MSLILSILPIIIILFCGYLLIKTNLIPKHDWRGIETLSFNLLIPAVLIKYIASSNLSIAQFGPPVFSIIASSSLVALCVLLFRKLISKQQLSNASLSTLFQATTRWNAFITLVAVELFIGDEGLVLVAVVMAVLIPIINVSNITVLAVYGSAEANFKQAIIHILKNPIVISCLIGLSINISGLTLPVALEQSIDFIGRAAIAIGLLAVGAGIDPARLFKSSLNLWLGVCLRLIAVPIMFLLIANAINLDATQTLVGILVLAAPTATHGYFVAKKMGGDAELYADVLSWQVVLSMLLLPLYVSYLK